MPSSKELQSAVADCFSTPAGRDALRYLRLMFKERALPPDTSAQVLTHHEGQRYVVAHIEQFVVKGQGIDVGQLRTDLADAGGGDANADADPGAS